MTGTGRERVECMRRHFGSRREPHAARRQRPAVDRRIEEGGVVVDVSRRQGTLRRVSRRGRRIGLRRGRIVLRRSSPDRPEEADQQCRDGTGCAQIHSPLPVTGPWNYD